MTRLHKIALTFILAFQPLLSLANDGHGLWLERLSHSGHRTHTSRQAHGRRWVVPPRLRQAGPTDRQGRHPRRSYLRRVHRQAALGTGPDARDGQSLQARLPPPPAQPLGQPRRSHRARLRRPEHLLELRARPRPSSPRTRRPRHCASTPMRAPTRRWASTARCSTT